MNESVGFEYEPAGYLKVNIQMHQSRKLSDMTEEELRQIIREELTMILKPEAQR